MQYLRHSEEMACCTIIGEYWLGRARAIGLISGAPSLPLALLCDDVTVLILPMETEELGDPWMCSQEHINDVNSTMTAALGLVRLAG